MEAGGRTQNLTNRKGRTKGSKNKFTTLKQAMFDVFQKLDGADGLYRWAKQSNHTKEAFYQMMTKLLPKQVDIKGDIEHKHSIASIHKEYDDFLSNRAKTNRTASSN